MTIFVCGPPSRPPRPATISTAEISPCGTYRFELTRTWESARGRVGWIMLNPSTADAEVDDPTIRRCMDFARRWGYGGIVVRNLYALRATDPKLLKTHPDPVGPGNSNYLLRSAQDPLTVCAWGASGPPINVQGIVYSLIAAGVRLHHLGLTKGGQPRHPLYLKGVTKPIRWRLP